MHVGMQMSKQDTVQEQTISEAGCARPFRAVTCNVANAFLLCALARVLSSAHCSREHRKPPHQSPCTWERAQASWHIDRSARLPIRLLHDACLMFPAWMGRFFVDQALDR